MAIGSATMPPARPMESAGRIRPRWRSGQTPTPWPLPLQRLAVLLLTLLAGRYLIWRCGATLNLSGPAAITISLVALIAETLLIGVGFLQLWFSLLPRRPMLARAEQAAAALALRLQNGATVPRVDVLVPCCGEPFALVERCLRGCLALEYPAFRVWLLDDRQRPELRQLCDRLGCGYLARQEHRHAKAGNLNVALSHTDAELVAVFDADVVPLRSFLKRTVGLFEEPRVALVQTPQHDMSADPVRRNLRLERWLNADEEGFYRWVQPTRQSLGAVVCAGTGFVMRREALQRVGGFDTETPSEDLATGIRLAAAGYDNLYLPERLSAGLAPATVAAMARQRGRWAGGTVQVLRTGASPLRLAGLMPLQRLGFLEGIAHWLAVLPQVLLALVIPLAIALLGVAPLRVDAAGLLWVGLPFQLAQLLLVRWLSVHSRAALVQELYRWIFLLPLCGAVLTTLLGRPQRFEVTAKSQGARPRVAMAWSLAWPLISLLLLQGLAMLRALRAHRLGSGGFSEVTLLVTLAWMLLTSLLLLLSLRACWHRPGGGGAPWFRLEQPVLLRAADGRQWRARLEAIGEEGAELRLDPPQRGVLQHGPALGEPLQFSLLPIGGQGVPLLELPWTPRLQRRDRSRRLGGVWGDGRSVDAPPRHTVPATPRDAGSGPLPERQRELLQDLLYRRPGLWPQEAAPWDLLALPVALLQLLRPQRREQWFRRSLLPQAPAAAEALASGTAPGSLR